jgi:DNA-binding MarR family transcriptional regulator
MNSVNGRAPFVVHGHLGVLFERARRRMFEKWEVSFRSMSDEDLRIGDIAVMAFLPPDGARVTDLARRARITKQSMGELVADLERRGYVERVAHPADGRAKLVVFTERGRSAAGLALVAAAQIESEWATRLGADRIEDLRETLEEIVDAPD